MSRQMGQDIPAEAPTPAATVEAPVAPATAVAGISLAVDVGIHSEVVDVDASPMLAVRAVLSMRCR